MTAISQGMAYLKRDIARKQAIIKDIDGEVLELTARVELLIKERAIASEALDKMNETLTALESL